MPEALHCKVPPGPPLSQPVGWAKAGVTKNRVSAKNDITRHEDSNLDFVFRIIN